MSYYFNHSKIQRSQNMTTLSSSDVNPKSLLRCKSTWLNFWSWTEALKSVSPPSSLRSSYHHNRHPFLSIAFNQFLLHFLEIENKNLTPICHVHTISRRKLWLRTYLLREEILPLRCCWNNNFLFKIIVHGVLQILFFCKRSPKWSHTCV